MIENNTLLNNKENITDFDFKQLLDKNKLDELNACGSCMVSIGHIINKEDLINIGSGIIGACNIGIEIHSMIASLMLSGIVIILQAFKKIKIIINYRFLNKLV
jgi:hypothetical protein